MFLNNNNKDIQHMHACVGREAVNISLKMRDIGIKGI